MKKSPLIKSLIVGTLLATSSLSASSFYFGMTYGQASNTDTREYSDGSTFENSNDYSDIKFKIGAGEDGGWKTEMGISKISYDSAVLAPVSSAADGIDLTELTFNFKKEFEVTKSVYPFINAGFGFGTMSESAIVDGTITEVSFNIGAGISYEVIEDLYLEGGFEYVQRQWQNVEFSSGTTLDPTATATKSYVGVNIKF